MKAIGKITFVSDNHSSDTICVHYYRSGWIHDNLHIYSTNFFNMVLKINTTLHVYNI